MSKPKFEPKAGQVDFTNVRWAPVINCVLKHEDKILLVQRSPDLNFYPGYWNGISGFLDDNKSLKEKVIEEIMEETGIGKEDIEDIRLGEIFDQEEPQYNKSWIVHPVLVEVKTEKISIDWENKKYRWLTLKEIRDLNLLPGFDLVLAHLDRWIGDK